MKSEMRPILTKRYSQTAHLQRDLLQKPSVLCLGPSKVKKKTERWKNWTSRSPVHVKSTARARYEKLVVASLNNNKAEQYIDKHEEFRIIVAKICEHHKQGRGLKIVHMFWEHTTVQHKM